MASNEKEFGWHVSLEATMNSFQMSLKSIAFLAFIFVVVMVAMMNFYIEIRPVFTLNISDVLGELLSMLNDALMNRPASDEALTYRAELFGNFFLHLKQLIIGSSPFAIGATWLMFDKIKRDTKKNMGKNKYLSGTELVTEKEIIKETKLVKYNFKLGPIPVPIDSETTGFMIGGSSGAGKTQLLRPIIKNIIDRKQKAIIHDIKGDIISEFYNEYNGHLIFNPLDARSEKTNWTIFNDIRNFVDIKNFVAWAIPEMADAKDPFWVNSARGILEGILFIVWENQEEKDIPATNEEIKKYAGMTGDKLSKALLDAGHNAASDYAAKKDSLSTFRSYMAWLLFLPDGDFSVRKWIESEDSTAIFLCNREDTREMLKSVMSLFINVAGSHLLSLEDDLDRRVHLVLDEFTNLAPLPKVLELLKMGRSKGVVVILAFQDYQQLEKIYSQADMYTFINNTGCKAVLRLGESKAAKYFAENFGQYTFLEKNQTISMGVAVNRDGLSINEQRKDEFAVKDTDILNLQPLFVFVKIVRIEQMSKVKIKPLPKPPKEALVEGYIEKKIDVKTQIRLAKALSIVEKNKEKVETKTIAEVEEEGGDTPEEILEFF